MNQLITGHNQMGGWKFGGGDPWWTGLKERIAKNVATSAELMADRTVPMNYYCPLKIIQDALPEDAIISSEGAATMDIGRTILNNK
jgi:hypothetical protein